MLQSLHIQNYAIIDDLSIEFKEGLTVITGETGAGKSIIVGALGLLTGQRSDKDTLWDKNKKCIVEASFHIGKLQVKEFFEQNNLDYSETAILRREITPDGRSRAFINDTPVNLAVLKEICTELVDIHSQHEILLVGEKDFQLNVVDAFAHHDDILDEYGIIYRQWKKDVQQLELMKAEEARLRKEQDFFTYQLDELENAKLLPGELEQLENENMTLEHALEIKSALRNAGELLSGSDVNILSRISSVKNLLSQAAKFQKSSDELLSRISSVQIELKDISGELENASDSIEDDPARLEQIIARLDLLNRLLKKHNLKTTEELIDLKNSLQEKINNVESLSNDITALAKKAGEEEKKLYLAASKISANRTSATPRLTEAIHKLLKQLGMPNAKISIQHDRFPVGHFGKNGTDIIRFMFLPNKGGEFKELAKVASGGEMSRLMLSIKASVARGLRIPTMILDEIDSGVSGEVASKVASILIDLSKTAQVITITHLPQIAAKGDEHYIVYKKTDAKTTKTFLKMAGNEERILEIAKMLSGEKVTDAAMVNAKVLLS